MTIKEFFSFKTNKFFWLNIVAMIVVVVVMIFGVLKWMDVYTHHGETVVVPDVKGMTTEEAANLQIYFCFPQKTINFVGAKTAPIWKLKM